MGQFNKILQLQIMNTEQQPNGTSPETTTTQKQNIMKFTAFLPCDKMI